VFDRLQPVRGSRKLYFCSAVLPLSLPNAILLANDAKGTRAAQGPAFTSSIQLEGGSVAGWLAYWTQAQKALYGRCKPRFVSELNNAYFSKKIYFKTVFEWLSLA